MRESTLYYSVRLFGFFVRLLPGAWYSFWYHLPMKLTEWFNTREIDDFARSIADEIIKRVPPGSLNPLTKKAAGQLKN